MRYRKLSATGDYTFGHGSQDFLVNSPGTVGQAVQTALALVQGEWFLDNTAGTPYDTQVLGTGTSGLYDQALQTSILDVTGVTGLTAYSSSRDPVTRLLSVAATINTVYGSTSLQGAVGSSPATPTLPGAVVLENSPTEYFYGAGLFWASIPNADSYAVYVGTAPGEESLTPVLQGPGNNVYVPGLTTGTTYYFYVRAYAIGAGFGPISNEVSYTPGTNPSVVIALSSDDVLLGA